MKNKIYSIYRATNIVNGKVYIGFDSNWPKRKNEHLWEAKRGAKYIFCKAIRKYNSVNFVWDIIYQSTDGEHTKNVMEGFFIKEYNANVFVKDSNGYNMTFGGEGTVGYRHTEETKLKISSSNTGKKMSKESIEKTRNTKKTRKYDRHRGQFQKGNLPWNKDKPMSDEYSISCSRAQQKRFENPEEHNKIIQAGIKGRNAIKEKSKIKIVFPDGRTEVLTIPEFAKKYNYNIRTVYWNIKKYGNLRIPSGKLVGFIFCQRL